MTGEDDRRRAVQVARLLRDGCGVCGAPGFIEERAGRFFAAVLHAPDCAYAIARKDQQDAADLDERRRTGR